MQENGDPGTAITASGSKLVTPAVSTTYLITATGNGKTVYRHVTVTVRGKMSWKRDIIYLGGKEVGEVDGTGGRSVLTDHLGTPRILVNPDSTVIEQKFAPFGESLTEPAAMNSFAKGFTNHEQTDPSGLIYMQARFYAPMYHRFLSPDPALDQHFEFTQSWNIYSYVQNSPIMSVDPDGMQERGAWTKFLDRTQAVLDTAGLFPVVGEFADGASGLISLGRGDWKGAGLSALSLVPIGGQAAGVAKLARTATKESAEVLAKKAAQLKINKAAGEAAEELVKKELDEAGTLLASRVGVQTSEGLRVIDHLADEGGKLVNKEVKSGGATRNARQVLKDKAMATEGGKIVGKNAPPDLKGQIRKIETEVVQK